MRGPRHSLSPHQPTRTKGAPAARNRGILECLGEEILTVDDDIILADDLVRTCRLFRPSGKSVVTGPKVIYLRDGETTTQAIERTKPDASLPYMDMGRLLLTPWAGDGKAIRVPFITSIALWPRDLFQKGLRYFEGYEGNGFREETDPQVQAQMRYEASVYLIPASFCFHLPLALAYADGGGQRRHGILWYEYWAIRNNAVFWMRNRKFLEEQWNVCSLRSQMKFVWHRLHVRRLINLLKNNS